MQQIERKDEKAFIVSTDEGRFEIRYSGNLDLYWRYMYTGGILSTADTKSFVITEENQIFYELLAELYLAIKDCNIPFHSSDFKERLQSSQSYNPERLFKDDKIEWHSDDAPYEESSVLTIEKVGSNFVITFVKSQNMMVTYSICIANGGSRHEPFNNVFMNLFQKLGQILESNIAYQVKPNQ